MSKSTCDECEEGFINVIGWQDIRWNYCSNDSCTVEWYEIQTVTKIVIIAP